MKLEGRELSIKKVGIFFLIFRKTAIYKIVDERLFSKITS